VRLVRRAQLSAGPFALAGGGQEGATQAQAQAQRKVVEARATGSRSMRRARALSCSRREAVSCGVALTRFTRLAIPRPRDLDLTVVPTLPRRTPAPEPSSVEDMLGAMSSVKILQTQSFPPLLLHCFLLALVAAADFSIVLPSMYPLIDALSYDSGGIIHAVRAQNVVQACELLSRRAGPGRGPLTFLLPGAADQSGGAHVYYGIVFSVYNVAQFLAAFGLTAWAERRNM
jgi:hypothetical protein